MEHIKTDLANLSRGISTPQTIEPEQFPTLEEKREELRLSLGVSSLDNTFENFDAVKGTEKVLSTFKSLVSGVPIWNMLLCYGPTGNGKSHLCESTAIALYKKGIFIRVLTMDRMIEALKQCIGPDRYVSFEELMHNYSYGERLIIDDVTGTEWEFEQLEKIIRVRYREKLFTILTTNRDLKELPERIVSRFEDIDVARKVLNSGADYRKLKGKV